MSAKTTLVLLAALAAMVNPCLRGADVSTRVELSVIQGVPRLTLPAMPGNDAFTIESASDLGSGFTFDQTGRILGYEWRGTPAVGDRFYRVRLSPMSPDATLTAIVLNRLAYGPTPDELERVLSGPNAIGPAAYLAEQLTPESIPDDLDIDRAAVEGEWQFVSVTGTATSSILYLYLTTAGEAHVDDLKLVRGTTPDAGPNLLQNGDFEASLAGTWTVATNLAGSILDTTIKKTGVSSLKLLAASGGSSRDSSIWQTVSPALANGQTYTLSYWFRPTRTSAGFTARLSGSGLNSQPVSLASRLAWGAASRDDLRAWHLLHAVKSRRQLLAVLTQFFDNHFTTQHSKSRDYMDGQVSDDDAPSLIATEFEYRELRRWRDVLLNPNGTFLDLLKISAESPAMIIYLDTVTSRGGSANENYSRELYELFTFGVDNGYDQTDIEETSRAWTGWRVDKLPPSQAGNPFADRVANRDTDPGVWTLRYRTDRHDNTAKTIFKGKTVDARFGAPHAGTSYELKLPARTGTAGMQDGYAILSHIADLPYTQEYLCVKLCRLFVHENFHHGEYDYTDPDLPPEGRLIHTCMRAWDTPGPDGRRGNLRAVLGTIFDSDLFRTQTALRQKVKTPFEFVASTIRALRAVKPGGGFTADTDGYDMLTTLSRLNMSLFSRADPDGWPEAGRDWISTAALVERIRFAQNFLIAPNDALKDVDFGGNGDDNVSDPVGLLQLKLSADRWRDAEAVVDYFLGILFPGEGRANLDLDRATAIAFLDTTNAGATSPFAALSPGTAAYDARIRSLVGLLLSLPRFQEQ